MYTGRGKSQLTEYASYILLVIYFTIPVAYYFNLPVKGRTQRNHFNYLGPYTLLVPFQNYFGKFCS